MHRTILPRREDVEALAPYITPIMASWLPKSHAFRFTILPSILQAFRKRAGTTRRLAGRHIEQIAVLSCARSEDCSVIATLESSPAADFCPFDAGSC